ncbi:rhodanese-like domain-containing protein [Labilibaculum sp.]|uniref:rhodanese-like domain-containing protein n=1 Tax=Labilibaculum sp. TaxID=2060723 RepID=UPI0035673746
MSRYFTNDASDKTDISPLELVQKLEKNKDFILLDVREHSELQICSLKGAKHIPMGHIASKMGELPKHKDLIVFCHMGVRSRHVINYLRKNGYTRAFNLRGGIDRWSMEVDPSLRRYR